MGSTQVNVFCMWEQNTAELKMGARFYARGRLKIKDRLQAMNTESDIWRIWRPEALSEP